jgi:hypothetical protein
MAGRQRAREEGVEPRWRMNTSATRLMLDLIDEQGKLDTEDMGPVVPKAADEWDDPFGPAQTRWMAERRNRLSTMSPAEVKLSLVNFSSNDDWFVLPLECVVIADALSTVTDDQIRAVLEADEVEMEAINDPDVHDPPNMATAIANVERKATEFSEYCRAASEYGGFRVS